MPTFTRAFPGAALCLPLAAAAMLMAAGPSYSQVKPSLAGRVVDAQGLPVAGARLALESVASSAGIAQTTGADGKFRFDGLTPGAYMLKASAEGLQESALPVALERRPVALTVTLDPDAVKTSVTVVSGSRMEELQTESVVKVEVLSREQIRHSAAERVSDVLGEVPGVVVRSGTHGAGVTAGEQIQGIDSRQVAVLLDGLPLAGGRGIKSGILNLNRQPIGALERVEVVKGAASALYGSDAIGGVINLITREPSDAFEGSLSLSGGTLRARDFRADAGTRWRHLSLYLDLERHQQDGYGLLPNATVGPDYGRNDLLFRSRYAASPRLSMQFAAQAYHNREAGLGAAQAGRTRGTTNDSSQTYRVVTDILPDSFTSLQMRAYSARYDENSRIVALERPENAPSLANLNERYRRLDATLARQFGTRHFAQAGAEWARDQYRGNNRLLDGIAGHQVTLADGWAQDQWTVNSRITLNAGGRYHRHSTFGGYFAPKAGVVVRVAGPLTARASFGSGFRAPDIGQLYYRYASPTSFYQVIGNPGLGPETSRSYSAGLTYARRRMSAALHFYRNDVHNLIDSWLLGMPRTTEDLARMLESNEIPPSYAPLLNRQLYIYRNVSEIFTRGFAADASARLSHRILVAGSYAFLDARDELTGLRLAQRHRHQGAFRAEYNDRRRGLFTNLRGTFFSSWLVNAARGTRAYHYSIWDVYAAKRVARGVELFGSIENL
ncbi:MAG: TonB-dependent receptor [Acidobacteria bacterium]|nr:TonB-dependent receptor [Acidobacteriota bacterium]